MTSRQSITKHSKEIQDPLSESLAGNKSPPHSSKHSNSKSSSGEESAHHDHHHRSHRRSHHHHPDSEKLKPSQTLSSSDTHDVLEVWNPDAKPIRGILKKPGFVTSHKSQNHIHLTETNDNIIHDAEKKNTKMIPIEGIHGMIMRSKSLH